MKTTTNSQELIKGPGVYFPSLMKMKGLISFSGQTIWSEESFCCKESKSHLEPPLPTNVDPGLAQTPVAPRVKLSKSSGDSGHADPAGGSSDLPPVPFLLTSDWRVLQDPFSQTTSTFSLTDPCPGTLAIMWCKSHCWCQHRSHYFRGT